MDIRECYLGAIQRAEKNATNGNISLDLGRFVNLFNSCQLRLMNNFLSKRNNDEIRKIQKLAVFSKILKRKSAKDDRVLFFLPDDFLSFINARGRFSKGECEVMDFKMWEVKNENTEELYNDLSNEPHFEFRETFYTIGQECISVFTKGFDCEACFMTYYRFPREVDIEGYTRFDGSPSSSIDPELDDSLVEMILDMVANKYALNEDEYDSYQTTKDYNLSPR